MYNNNFSIFICLVAVISNLIFLSANAANYNYGEVIGKSMLFYEAQRSGHLPPSQRVSWRSDSFLNDSDGSVDLSGGYFNAGDYIKFQQTTAFTMTILAWSGIDYKDTYASIGQTKYLLDTIKWGTDYFIKAHPLLKHEDILYIMIGNVSADHGSWGRPEDWVGPRPVYKITRDAPGSDMAGETAAAMAAASILFRESNITYSRLLLKHASSLYKFAIKYQGKFSDSVPGAAVNYRSSNFTDELAWASIWMYRATGRSGYLTNAEIYFERGNLSSKPHSFDWDDKSAGVQLLLAQLTGKQVYKDAVIEFCDYSINKENKTAKGLLWLSPEGWGALRYAANIAAICLLASEEQLGLNNTRVYREFGKAQIGYALGDTGRSFVIGWGVNPPIRVHHRAASCPNKPASCGWADFHSKAANPHVLTGSLIAGPGYLDDFEDDREDFKKNEVALDFNAGFQLALTILESLKK